MIRLPPFFFFNDTATTEIYTPFPTRRSSDLHGQQGHWTRFLPDRTAPDRIALTSPSAVLRLSPPTRAAASATDRKSTRLNSSHANISYAVFCLKKKTEYVD